MQALPRTFVSIIISSGWFLWSVTNRMMDEALKVIVQ
jgi:hypothetical protein